MPDIVILSDRIKEHSRTEGTGNFALEGAAAGFSAFGEFYSHGDILYYAVTDGSYYEVGSGIYHVASENQLRRFPFRSKGPGSTGTEAINWGAGLKEVYVTYPAAQSVYTASGVDPAFSSPEAGGLAFWESANILNYDPSLIWDRPNNRLGVNQSSPSYAVDVGGNEVYSQVRASGFIAGSSGVTFPSGNSVAAYLGGRQLEHFVRNEVNSHTGADQVVELSGVVDNIIRLKQQSKGHVFAGPPSGCGVGCSPAYPTFRYLTIDDLPDLKSSYGSHLGTAAAGYVTIWNSSSQIGHDTSLFFDTSLDRLGIGTITPSMTLDVVGGAQISDNLVVKGNLDVRGTTTYINSSNVTIADKVVELASLSGTALATDAQIEAAGGAGIMVRSLSPENKSFVWRSGVAGEPGHWTTNSWIKTSGVHFLWNDSKISGAYQAGSGLELHGGIKFNVGNVFAVKDQDATSANIHQADNLIITGVSGVKTVLSTNGANKTITIDPSELSGILQNSAGGFTLFDGGGSSQDIAAKDTVRLLEGGGVNVAYTDSTGPDYAITFTAENIDTTHINSTTLVTASEATEFLPNSDIQIPTSAAISGLLATAGSGLIKLGNTLNLNVPSGSYSELLAAGAASGDSVLVWDSGNYAYTYMSLGELQKKVDTAGGGGSSNTWSTIDVNDTDSGFTWGTSDVTTASAGETIKLVAGDHMALASDATGTDAVRFTNIGTPVVSGMLNVVSGIANTNSSDIVTASGALRADIHVYNAGSGLVKHGSSPYTFNLNDPTVSYSALVDTAAQIASDKVLVWDHTASVWKHMTFLEVQQLIDTQGAGAADAFRDFDIANGDAVSPTWSTTEVVVAANSNDKINLFAGTGILLESDNDTSAIRFSNIGAATVSGMLVNASGALDARITSNSGNISSNTTNITSVSGLLYEASGQLNTDIQTVSGLAVPAGSHSGIALFNSSQRISDSYMAGSGMVWDSGNGSLMIGGVNDGTASALFVDTNTKARQGIVIQASTDQTANLFELRAPDGTLSGIYIDSKGHLVGAAHGGAEFFAGREAGEYAVNATSSVLIGQNAGKSSENLSRGVAIGYQAGQRASGVEDSIFIGSSAGNRVYGKERLGVALSDHELIAIGNSALLGASGTKRVVAIGPFEAGLYANDCEASTFIGHQAGSTTSGVTNSNAIGLHAAHGAKDCSDTNMMGTQAGYLSKSNTKSSFIGYGAGQAATGCDYSNIIGHQAGLESNLVTYSDYVGYRAGAESNSTEKLIAIGYDAAWQATGVKNSVAIGHQAGYSADNNEYLEMIGFQAGYGATGCYSSTMIGYQAGASSNQISSGVLVGNRAGTAATGITHGLGLGYHAMAYAKDLTNVTAIGHFAGYKATGCLITNMIGYKAGEHAISSSYSNFVGINAGVHASGDNMIGVGYNAGSTVATGVNHVQPDNLIAIGNTAGYQSKAVPDVIFIGRGAGENAREELNTVAIGRDAGANDQVINDGAGLSATNSLGVNTLGQAHANNQNNIYIGYGAGFNHRGNHNIHIQAGVDELGTPSSHANVGYGGINIGNIIWGQGGPHTYRGIQIGQPALSNYTAATPGTALIGLSDSIGATLAVKAKGLGSQTKPTVWIKSQTGQSGPLLQADVPNYAINGPHNDSATSTTHAYINANGLFCLPIFNSNSDVPPAASNKGAFVIVRQGTNQYYTIFSNGSNWLFSGTNTSQYYSPPN